MKNVKQGHPTPIVCLDAGHFGKYNRSAVVPEFYESEVNWKLHNLLAQRLEEYGIKVVKTRLDQDTDLDLVYRGRVAKDCDLFVSMHVNAADNTKANYVLGVHMVDDDCSAIDEQSKQVAKRLADCVADIMGVKAQVWTKESSSDRDKNGHLDDYYGVLRGAHGVGTAGVILEHGFYTNKEQADFLLDENNLAKLADAEAKVIADWFDMQKMVQSGEIIGNPYKLELTSLRKGSRGLQVEMLQVLLIATGFSCGKSGMDGSFGADTEKAVKLFQTANGLSCDGVAGPKTMRALLGYR